MVVNAAPDDGRFERSHNCMIRGHGLGDGSRTQGGLTTARVVNRRPKWRVLGLMGKHMRIHACVDQLPDGLEKGQRCAVTYEY